MKFTDKQKFVLIKEGISNGCGKKGGFNFSNFFDKVQKFIGFKSKKFESFKSDIKEICSYDHDVRFYIGGNLFDFLSANLDFTLEVLKLMRWTSSYCRLISFLTIFFGLSIFGVSAFNWGKKNNLNLIFKKYGCLENGEVTNE